LGEAAMRGAGFDDEDARILTDHVLDAALCGCPDTPSAWYARPEPPPCSMAATRRA
jgi:hypothetical protein